MTTSKLLIAISFIAIALLAWIFLFDLNRVAVFHPEGVIKEGSIMGIAVGDDYPNAALKITSLGFEPASLDGRSDCLGEYPEIAEGYKFYLHKSWRNGALCIFVSEHNRISKVKWGFAIFSL